MGRATDRVLAWCDVHERGLVLAIVGLSLALRVLLIANGPSYGYVWDFYQDGVRMLAEQGRLPVAADCWQCYHPPLFYVVGWPFYAWGRWLSGGNVAVAERVLAASSVIWAAVPMWCGYRLLALLGHGAAARLAGLALLSASPLLFLISFGAEADTLLTAILSLFIYQLTAMHLRPERAGLLSVMSLGVLSGLAMATKYSGLVALATAGAMTIVALWRGPNRLRVAGAGLLVLALTLAIGGWKYIENLRAHGTMMHANGSASAGLSLGSRDAGAPYEFTSFRLQELRALFGPRPPVGQLTDFPVYNSVITTLHAQAWSDMSFFSVPSRHGAPGVPYSRRIVPLSLITATILLGFVPELLAMVGLVVVMRDRRYWPMMGFAAVMFAAYTTWFLPQQTWALKTKYIAALLPVMAALALAGFAWIGRRAPVLAWVTAGGWATLIGCAYVYQYAFALGRL